jgi:RNA polymerase sigma-70 factor, ECF subfamily
MRDNHELGPLLSRVLAGDGQAQEALLAKIRPYLHLLVRQQLERDLRHKLDDSDIVQETLMRIHGGLNPAAQGPGGQFQGRAPPEFLAWVSQIVRHVIIDMERRGKARKRDERREVPGSKVLATLSQGSTPEQAAERAEKALHLAAALERLPRHQREVLEWRVFEQLSYAEISERTGKSEGALRVVATRAMEALRADEQLRRLMGASS